MSEPKQREKRTGLKRYAAVKLMFGLFPLLVAGGFLAPGWVQLMAVAQVDQDAPRGPVVDRVGPYGRRPLLVPRDFSAGFMPALLDLDQLFLGSRRDRHGIDEQVARVDSFDRSFGDLIAFDDLGEIEPPVEFEDVLMAAQDTVLAAFDADDTALPLCGTLFAGNCVRDDDFGFSIEIETQPVPEPETSALLGLGLIGLAWQGRRARSAR